jgi:hypothetical protein
MQITDVFSGGAALFDGPPIVGDGASETGTYDYAALGYDALPPFSGATSVEGSPFGVDSEARGGVEVTGRISAGMLALMIVGIVGFYFWTRNYQH